MKLVAGIAMVGWLCTAAVADEGSRKQRLIDQIVASGTNEDKTRRHTVIVQMCVMTTFFWKKHEDQGFVLWSSFLFDMASAEFNLGDNAAGELFVAVPNEGSPEDRMAVVGFGMRPPALARHEKSNFRPKKGETSLSPRNNGETHY